MYNFFDKQRVGAMTSFLTSILIASGCRSASVNSGPGYNSGSGPVMSPPPYRTYEQSPQPYENDFRTPSPQPPSVLPVPGYSDEQLPPAPPSPSPPSTQKTKRNPIPSGFRFPSMSRQNQQVNQTGTTANSNDLQTTGKRQSNSSAFRDQTNNVNDDVVALPSPLNTQNQAALTPPTMSDARLSRTSVPLSPQVGQSDFGNSPVVLPNSNTSIRSRYGVAQQWPSNKTVLPSQTNNAAPSESNSNSATTSSTTDQDSSSSNANVPLLLPPPL